MDNNRVRFYEFGEFRLDTKRRILIKDGNKIPLSGKNFDLLFVMIQNEGRVLEHDELLDKVWEGLFVEQANLKKSISNLRHILGESPNESLYIKTIPRRGYSFVAEVRPVEDEVSAPPVAYREIETEIEIEEIIETSDAPDQETARAELPAAAPTVKTNSKLKRILIPGVAVLLLLVAGIFVFQHVRSRSTLNFSIENVRARRLTTEGNLGNSAPVSPDGNYLVYPVYQGEEGSLWLKQIQTGSLLQLMPLARAQFWAYDYSPDGIFVYYIINHLDEPGQSGLYRVPTFGGTPQKLVDRANGGLSFAVDGSRFAFTRLNDLGKIEIITAKLDGSDEKSAYVVPDNKFIWSVKWSPDNKNLLCSVRERKDSKLLSYITEIPWNNNPEKPSENIIIPPQENMIFINAAWTPEKSSLLLSIREQNADICQIWQYFPASGERQRVTNDGHSYRFINLTRDGKSLVTVQESYQSEIWVADSKTLDFHAVPNVKNVNMMFWSKDNRLIYDALEDSRNTVFVATEDGIFRQQITGGSDGIYLFPSLSQDGNSVTFVSNRNGANQIWQVGLDGKNERQLTNADGVGLRSKLLSDNQTLLFMRQNLGTGWILYKQADGKIVPLTNTDTSMWSLSPDEQFLAIEHKDEKTKKYKISIQNIASGEIIKTFDFSTVRHLSWTRDGKAIVYIAARKDADELILQPIDGSAAKILTNTRGQRIASFDWSPDGSKLAVVRSKFMTDAFMFKAQEN